MILDRYNDYSRPIKIKMQRETQQIDDKTLARLDDDVKTIYANLQLLELWKNNANSRTQKLEDEIKREKSQREKTESRIQELENWKRSACYKIKELEDWKRNLLCAKSYKVTSQTTLPPLVNWTERSRAVVFLCPLCCYIWYKLLEFREETHGNFWVMFDPSDIGRTKRCFLVSTQYEFYPAIKQGQDKRKSWRDSNDFKEIREHLLLCYKGKNGSELDDDQTGRFDMWRKMDMIKKEGKFHLNGKGMRRYHAGEVKRIINDGAKEEIEKKRSKFLVQFKDTFDLNLMQRVAGPGYQPEITWVDERNDRKRREREKKNNVAFPATKKKASVL
jgi:hypothetical protein